MYYSYVDMKTCQPTCEETMLVELLLDNSGSVSKPVFCSDSAYFSTFGELGLLVDFANMDGDVLLTRFSFGRLKSTLSF